MYPANLGEIPLLECVTCGFGYFGEMLGWPQERYRNEIYNADYHLCDPPFREERPKKLAAWLARNLNICDIIDFGGGQGRLAELLVEKGFPAHCYDPFYGEKTLPFDSADVVMAFEVVEHVPDQRLLFRSLTELCRPGGLIVFSTLLKPRHLISDWWYASPRNGHVSFHTTDSLKRLMMELGLARISLSRELHIAAQQASVLAFAAPWDTVPVADVPGYMFMDGWQRLRPTKCWAQSGSPR